MILSAARSRDEARAIGLATGLAEDAALLDAAVEAGLALAAGPLAAAHAKRRSDSALRPPSRTAALEADLITRCFRH